jgi:cysteine synthase
MTDAVRPDVLQLIGATRLVPLRKVRPVNGARVLLKMENENPTGSMKDRMALAMIEAAEQDGRLQPGGAVVEYTGGSTGVSLSLVCAVKGYPLHIVSSDAFAREKLDHMRILGARLTVVASDGGRMTEKLTRDMIEIARGLTAETGGFWTDQLNNADQLAAYHAMAERHRRAHRCVRAQRGHRRVLARHRRGLAAAEGGPPRGGGGAGGVAGAVRWEGGSAQDRRHRRRASSPRCGARDSRV